MSQPDTNLKEQERRHRAPLIGMSAVVIFALVLLALMAVFTVSRGNEPGEAETGVDGAAPTEQPAD